MFYSAKRNIWYAPELKPMYLHSGEWPEDAVEYPLDIYEKTVINRPEGFLMTPGDNGEPTLIKIPPIPIIDVKDMALKSIEAYAKSMRTKIAGTGDEIEIAGWNNKLRIATSIQAGTATEAEAAAFAAEINARGLGESMEGFVAKVIRNAAFYAQAVGLIDGLKRKAQDAVEAAKTPAEVAAVLDAIKADAETAFAELMKAAS